MSHTPHDLAEDFPGQAALISELKSRDAHFARLADQYHEVNRAVHRAEAGVEPMSDEHETSLRKDRMRLKDEIARLLRAAEAAG
jgi:uncharacterized protein YdcH (DUF465 family)